MEQKNHSTSLPELELTKLLYKIVIQFGFFTQKSDKDLDGFLQTLTSALKKGTEFQQLAPELQNLSKLLTRLTKKKIHLLTPNTLINYLTSKANTLADTKLIQLTQQLRENSIKTEEQLFASLDELLVQNSPTQTPFPLKIPSTRLIHLLDAINVPAKFQQQWLTLKQQCDQDNLTSTAHDAAIDRAILLCSRIKSHAVDEQQQFDSFLFEITQRLTKIEETAEQASKENKISIKNRGLFSDALNSQVASIKTTASDALDLKELQNNIKQSLDKLSSQIQNHQTLEDHRQLELQCQLEEITEKLQHTEAESMLLRNKLQATHKLAFLDHLTGVPNRLAYDQRIELEILRWQRYKHPLSLIVWDIDFFKKINDVYGHKSGDKALVLIAQIIAYNCRKTDFVARYGGEEFVSLLPNTTAENALIVGEKIRNIVQKTEFKARGETIIIQISAGIHQFTLTDSIESGFDQADQALYHAKANGRNQCVISTTL